MGIRSVSLGVAAAALLGSAPVVAAAPVTPSVAKLALAPVAGTSLSANARAGVRGKKDSNIASTGIIVAVLAAGAVAGGIVAATDSGSNKTVSP